MKCKAFLKQPLIKQKWLCMGLVMAAVNLAGMPAMAQEAPLSAAEQAALDALQPVDQTQKLLGMCHHILLHGSDAQKTELLAALGDKTCTQGINEGLFDEPVMP